MNGTQDPTGKFWCDNCERWMPEEEMVGDDEPMCLGCYGDALDRDYDEMKENQA